MTHNEMCNGQQTVVTAYLGSQRWWPHANEGRRAARSAKGIGCLWNQLVRRPHASCRTVNSSHLLVWAESEAVHDRRQVEQRLDRPRVACRSRLAGRCRQSCTQALINRPVGTCNCQHLQAASARAANPACLRYEHVPVQRRAALDPLKMTLCVALLGFGMESCAVCLGTGKGWPRWYVRI